MAEPSERSLTRMWKFAKGFIEKSGSFFQHEPAVTESVVKGLALHVDELGSHCVHETFIPINRPRRN